MEEGLFRALSSGPRVVERLLRVFPHERLDEKIEPERFTARQVVAHLADYEGTALDRIRAANLKPGRNVEWYDPDAQAANHHFHDKEVFHEAEVFESRRGMTLEYLQGLTEQDLDKTFVLPDNNSVSIRQYLAKLLCHDLEHMEQLSSYLATEVATLG